jgi:hypothetical protein
MTLPASQYACPFGNGVPDMFFDLIDGCLINQGPLQNSRFESVADFESFDGLN